MRSVCNAAIVEVISRTPASKIRETTFATSIITTVCVLQNVEVAKRPSLTMNLLFLLVSTVIMLVALSAQLVENLLAYFAGSSSIAFWAIIQATLNLK